MTTSLMKKTLFFISIVVLSISTQAEDSLVSKHSIEKGFNHISNSAQTMLSPEQESPQRKVGNTSNLWKMLDIDSNGYLSKTEAAASKDVFNNWDHLDKNIDERLDSEEFAKVFYQVN